MVTATVGEISIHAPPRGATKHGIDGELTVQFQFTPLREGRQKLLRILGIETEFQFTPLREGRLCPPYGDLEKYSISIHAPPRGATMCREVRAPRPCHFNSRPSARGDFCGFPTTFALQISIHAPPRGATSGRDANEAFDAISIHAPPRGATSRADLSADGILFQFTPLREGRHYTLSPASRPTNFNSRPSARGDPFLFVAVFGLSHFNSRPSARGDGFAIKTVVG